MTAPLRGAAIAMFLLASCGGAPPPTALAGNDENEEVRVLHDVSDFVASHPLAVVDFHADWCEPCVAFAPIYAEVARARPAVAFGKVKEETDPHLVEKYRIEAFPTQIFFRDGKEIHRTEGAMLAPGKFASHLDEIFGSS